MEIKTESILTDRLGLKTDGNIYWGDIKGMAVYKKTAGRRSNTVIGESDAARVEASPPERGNRKTPTKNQIVIRKRYWPEEDICTATNPADRAKTLSDHEDGQLHG